MGSTTWPRWNGDSRNFGAAGSTAVRCTLAACAASAALALTGCAGGPAKASGEKPAPAQAPALELPPSAVPTPELAELAFMAGRWIGVNPNKTVNEEHWMSPRGNHMVGTFRQVRRDGKPAFVEVSLVTVDTDGVTLRLRHMHSGLEIPERRKELSVFRLKSAAGNRAEFAGTGDAQAVTGVVYRLAGPDQLAVDVSFAPTSKEKGFTSMYTREGR